MKIPKEIDENPQILFNDISQGDLGDCYFLCALSSVAEFTDCVRSFFNTLTISSNGVFECTFYIHGIKTQVVVDDYFPFFEYTPKDTKIETQLELAYANFNPKTNNLWALILEKCWAKLNVSYDFMAKGIVSDAFEVLFPAPIETYPNHIYANVLWDIITEADKDKYLICADISDDGDPFMKCYKKLGLVTNHAYTVISAK